MFWPQSKNNNEIKKRRSSVKNRSSIHLEFEYWNLKDTTRYLHNKVLRPQSNLVKMNKKIKKLETKHTLTLKVETWGSKSITTNLHVQKNAP